MLVKATDKNVIFMHTGLQNSKVLNPDGRSDICVKRVNAPVPDYSDNDSGEFHYVSSE